MSSTATPTSTATSAAASATGCGSLLYEIPTQDAACAVPYGGNHTDIMSTCCGPADVVSYENNCGLYCLAENQDVTSLTDCLTSNGVVNGQVFCNDVGNATASATTTASLTSGASIVASASHSGSTSASGTASGTSTGSSSTGSSSSNAAAGMSPTMTGVTMTSVTVWALLSVSFFMGGALQL